MTATRADVAKLAGVSPAVVSYVLSPGSRPVAPATRDKVLAAIDKLGYRPNAIARALRQGPTRSIGLLIPDHVNPFFAELAQKIGNLAFDLEYVMLLGSTEEDSRRETRYIQTFVDRRVDGIVLIAPLPRSDFTDYTGNIPVVVVDRVPEEPSIAAVRSDHLQEGQLGVGHLLDLGHRYVGLIAGPEHLAVSDDRIVGWRTALAEYGIKAVDSLLAHAAFTREGGYQAAETLLKDKRCTAIVASSDVQAIGAMHYLSSHSIPVPERISVVSVDGTDLARYSRPVLTRVVQPIEELAQAVMDILVSMMASPERERKVTILPTTLEVGGSTAPPQPTQDQLQTENGKMAYGH